MKRTASLLVAAAVAAAVVSAPAYAEMAQPQPSTVEKVKTMTKDEWAKMRATWKKDKAKYVGCRDKAKADGLKGRKRWAAVYDCMMQ